MDELVKVPNNYMARILNLIIETLKKNILFKIIKHTFNGTKIKQVINYN